jgi:hypothetical protein
MYPLNASEFKLSGWDHECKRGAQNIRLQSSSARCARDALHVTTDREYVRTTSYGHV